MKFPEIDVWDPVELLYFDTWEADRLMRVGYYSCIGLVWFVSVLVTVWCTVNYFAIGLVIGGALSLGLMFTGVLCIRLTLEGCLSLFMMRDAVCRINEYQEEEYEEEESEALEEQEENEEPSEAGTENSQA